MVKSIGAQALAALAAGLGLCGCLNFSSLDNLDTAPVADTPFSKALSEDYAFLAHSFGEVGQASYTSFDQDRSIPLANTDSHVAALANAFAQKALMLSRGEVVDPEPSSDVNTHELRDRLVRALTPGRDAYPRDAARAQADWDCWRLNLTAPSQAAAAARCHRSFEVTLARIESEAQAVAAAQATAAKSKGTAAANPDTDSDQTP